MEVDVQGQEDKEETDNKQIMESKLYNMLKGGRCYGEK